MSNVIRVRAAKKADEGMPAIAVLDDEGAGAGGFGAGGGGVLGEGEDGADIEEIEKKIKAAKMPADARKKADAELKKLKLMSPMSAEATVVRNYIDVLTGLPWAAKTKIKHNLANASSLCGINDLANLSIQSLRVNHQVLNAAALN